MKKGLRFDSAFKVRERSLRRYFAFYNDERPHQSLGNRTPRETYFALVEKRSRASSSNEANLGV